MVDQVVLIKEILSSDQGVSGDISADLMDLVSAYRQDKKDQIPMQGPNGAIEYLKKLGHLIDAQGVMTILTAPVFDEIVERSDPTMIKVKNNMPDSTIAPDEQAQSQDKVDKTAAKVATKTVQTGAGI